jgi:hypothetical protein
MGLLSSLPAKGVAALVLAGAIGMSYWFTYEQGNKNGVNALLVEQQAKTIKLLNDRVTANSALADGYRVTAEKDKATYEKEVADVRALAKRSTGRVPISASQFCGPASTTQAAKTGNDGPANPGTAFLPESFANDLRQLAADADAEIAAYRALRQSASTCFN